MLQYSKVLRGREEWKAKAIARGNENREHRKAIRDYRHKMGAVKVVEGLSFFRGAPSVFLPAPYFEL